MCCYSHLSDDEREQIGLGKALGRSIGAIVQAIARPKSTVWRELSPQQVAEWALLAASTPPEPINCAGGVKHGSKEIEPYRPSLPTGSRKGGPPSKLQAGGNEPGLRAVGCETIIYRATQHAEQLWRYLTRRHKRGRPRRSRPSQDTIKDRISIHEQPKNVDARSDRYGDAYVARELLALGHDVRQVPPAMPSHSVKVTRVTSGTHTQIAEAVLRPSTHCVPVKTDDRLDLQALHRVRSRPGRTADGRDQSNP
jgi:hypothetical protein